MKRRILLIATVLFVIASTGCKNGLDYMIEEYNSRFGIHDDSVLQPGDDGYDQRNMILPDYHIDRDHTLNIPAPVVKDATYKWQIFKDKKEITVLTEENGVTTSTFYLLENNLPIGTYTLFLTLTVGDKVLRDEAKVTVHKENSGYDGYTTPET